MIIDNGIYEIKAVDELSNEGKENIIVSNFDRIAPIITVVYKEPTIYTLKASISFQSNEKVIVTSQRNIIDLIVPGMSDYSLEHMISEVTTKIEGGSVTFKDSAGNEATVNVNIDTTEFEFVRISAQKTKPYGNLSIKSAFVLAQQMENKSRIIESKVRSYYGVNSGETDMFMSRARDYGAVAYLSYAKGIHSIEVNSSKAPVGEDYKTKTNQSSTGNIYGIYDLNGGQLEYAAFYIDSNQDALINQGKVLVDSDVKYKDVIKPNQTITILDKLRLYKGIAMTETIDFDNVTGILPTLELPFIIRNDLFNFAGNSGVTISDSAFRVTLINKMQ
jgi:hypothetical protein